MASLPTGSNTVLEVKTEYVDVVIKTKGKQISSVADSDAKSSSLKVVAVNVKSISVPSQSIDEKYPDHKGIAIHDYKVDPMFFEQTDYELTVIAKNGQKLAFESNNRLVTESISEVVQGDPTLLSGVINFRNDIGYSDFEVFADGKSIAKITVEVYPSKISYQEDYQAMMADINDMVNEVVLDFMKKTYQVFVPDHKRNEIPAVFFTVLQSIYDKYITAVNRIISVPHHKLVTEHEVVPYHKAKRTDAKSEKWLQKHPECVTKRGDSIYADRVLAVKKQITYDTQENRLVKYMLLTTARRIEDFRKRYKNSVRNPDETILSGSRKMEQELRRILSTSFLQEVSDYNATQSMSLVFGMAPGYRELYKYYLMLQNGITFGGDVFKMSIKDTAQLYEYWCFIKLYAILKDRYKLESSDVIKVDKRGVTVDLTKGKTSTVTFSNPSTNEKILLSYNQSETETQTVNQKPDNVLELEKNGSDITYNYKYIFDAKYRIENNPDGIFYPDIIPGPKTDDINTMHRYRDAIVYESKEPRFVFEKTMFGAYILFPYGNEEEYKDHKFYKSIETVNIGGLPFLPSATTLVSEFLDELISDSADDAFDRAILPKGFGERYKQSN